MRGSDDALIAQERDFDASHFFDIAGEFIVEQIGAGKKADDIVLQPDRADNKDCQLAEISCQPCLALAFFAGVDEQGMFRLRLFR